MTGNDLVTDISVVCIPWRPAPGREAPFERVTRFWEHHGFTVVTGDSSGESFSLCEARNNAVRASDDAPVVIVADADTIPDIGSVFEAVRTVQAGEVVWPFERYRHIPPDAVGESDLHAVRPDQEYRGSLGGLFVCLRETYWDFGGMDERFHPRWGYEDNAFHAVASTLGTVRRLPGCIYSFNHEADRDMSEQNPNRHRNEIYQACLKRPEMMRELTRQ